MGETRARAEPRARARRAATLHQQAEKSGMHIYHIGVCEVCFLFADVSVRVCFLLLGFVFFFFQPPQ